MFEYHYNMTTFDDWDLQEANETWKPSLHRFADRLRNRSKQYINKSASPVLIDKYPHITVHFFRPATNNSISNYHMASTRVPSDKYDRRLTDFISSLDEERDVWLQTRSFTGDAMHLGPFDEELSVRAAYELIGNMEKIVLGYDEPTGHANMNVVLPSAGHSVISERKGVLSRS